MKVSYEFVTRHANQLVGAAAALHDRDRKDSENEWRRSLRRGRSRLSYIALVSCRRIGESETLFARIFDTGRHSA